ncbi:MAG TPA: hypothetical protein VJI46_06490 [Candidatus Nanoarchaeia archaeon]|nr:hypothetical protein [Candidatus Nanoarchaeia archaeon]
MGDDDLLEEEKTARQNVDGEWDEKRKLIADFFEKAMNEPIVPPQPIPEIPTHSIVFETLDEEDKEEEGEEEEQEESEGEEKEEGEESEAEETEKEEPEEAEKEETEETEEETEKEEPEETEEEKEEPEEAEKAEKEPEEKEEPILGEMKEEPLREIPKKVYKKPFWKRASFWLLIIGIVLIVAVVAVFFIGRVVPPSIGFVDADTKEPIYGKIIYNGNEIGEFAGDYFSDIPSEFCKSAGQLALKQGDEVYTVDAYPGDCKSRKITYLVKRKEIGITEITFDFFAEDTKERLPGQLFIDGDFYGNISGTTKISVEECRIASKIRLVTKGKDVTWDNDRSKCAQVGLIEFTVPSIK